MPRTPAELKYYNGNTECIVVFPFETNPQAGSHMRAIIFNYAKTEHELWGWISSDPQGKEITFNDLPTDFQLIVIAELRKYK